jgi:pyruvate dehydrogenase E2 component (dihydrolipoamide acetyltransferase)
MIVDVVMPKMGESLTEGTIVKWLKKEGDKIERDEMILEISTDKVDTEVPSPKAGVLVKILAQENETVEVGEKIAEIETEADAAPAPKKEEKKAETPVEEDKPAEQETEDEPDGDTIDVVMPKMGESLTEGTIVKWLKKPGEKIERDEMILEISTDKVDTEVPSPVTGTLVEVLAEENQTVEVGEVIARISGSGKAPKKKATQKAADKPSEEKKTVAKSDDKQTISTPDIADDSGSKNIPRQKDGKFFSPLVRSIAEAEDVTLSELEKIDGSGIDGRITKADIVNYIEERKSAPQKKQNEQRAITKAAETKPSVTSTKVVSAPKPGKDVEVIPMDRIRKLIADHMVYSKHTSAHVTSVGEADVTHIFRYRESHKNAFLEDEGFKLTYTPFFSKAAIDAIKEFPMVNVSVDGTNILRHKRIHFSFATALPDGNLIVPVIKDADNLSFKGLARAIYDLSSRARSKELNPDDIQGGTFTMTNVGTFGTLFGSPVINQPQCAILGVGAIHKRPVVREYDGEDVIAIRSMVYVSITYDHRVIDGMLAGQYLAAVIRNLESMNETNIDL